MANKVYNMEGGLHSAAAYSAFENAMFGSCVASATDFVATAGTGMNVSLSAGNGMIDTGQGFSRRIASDATNTIPVTAASSANPRMDAVVAYIDNGVTPTTTVIDNTNNILKFACVAGSPAATPQAPSAATIQSAIGAGNPYVILWFVTIPKSATSLSGAAFTDNRSIATRINGSQIVAGTIGTNALADSAVTSDKIDWTTFGVCSATISSNATVAQGSAYSYVDVPNMSASFTAQVGGKYLMLLTAAVTCASASTECYARGMLNNNNAVTALSQNPSAGRYVSVCAAQVFTATQASNTIKVQIGGGAANANYSIAGGTISSLQVFRIG